MRFSFSLHFKQAEVIDKKKLIDTHYGAIAAKAVSMKPAQLTVQEKAQQEFEKQRLAQRCGRLATWFGSLGL